MKLKKFLSLALALVMAVSLAVPAMADNELPEGWTPADGARGPVMAGDELPEGWTPADGARGPVTADYTGSIVILHSNDVHGAVKGYATMAALKEYYKEAGAQVLLVDAGDYIQGATYVSVSQGKTAIELMNLAGYDYAALGNHEFDYGYANLVDILKDAKFEVLSANTLYDGKSAFGTHAVAELGDVKVGIFGLETPETATKAHPAKIQGVTFLGGEDLYACAQAEVDALKAEGVDYIVCLGHLGVDDETAATANRSIDLLAKVEGIDVLIDGHSHSTIEGTVDEKGNKTPGIIDKIGGEDNKVGDTWVTSTGTKFANCGVVTIAEDGVITTALLSAEEAAALVEPKAEVAEKAEAIITEIEEIYGATFATTQVLLNGEKDPGNRTQETNLGDLITDAMLWQATKDGGLDVDDQHVVALTNGGGIRATIQPGDITMNDVNTVLPFGNTVAIVYVDGATLLEVLEASTFCTPTAVGGFPQVAGIDFTVNTGVEFDQGELYPDTTYHQPASIKRVTINSVNGQEFDPAATYAVVTNDFNAAGGDTYYALSVAENVVDTGAPMDEALIAYITQVLDGVVTAEKYGETRGSIKIVDEPDVVIPADMDPDAWWYDAAAFCLKNGVMRGTDRGFDALAEVTEATVYQTLYNINNADGDVEITAAVTTPEGAWYADAVNWAAEKGLFEGESFADAVIDRGGIKAILDTYGAGRNIDTSKLMVGNENGDMMLDKTLTRAEFAQILKNMAYTPAVPLPLEPILVMPVPTI